MPAISPDSSFSFQHYLQSIVENNDTVLAELYRENFRATAHYVLQNSGTTEEAKDIYQEAFVVLWRNIQLKKFMPENKTAIAAYLFRVSKNKWISRLRSADKKHGVALSDSIDERMDDYVTIEQEDHINQLINKLQLLGDQCKELLTAFYYKKLKLSVIAAKFGWTDATAKNNKYRCLEKLRNLMKNQIN